ncbi:MAG: pyruvate, phosphate dikinase [Bacteroidales bacterium]|nr:pyruvate, phosphate dikinase [Bacteroidales bacterium]
MKRDESYPYGKMLTIVNNINEIVHENKTMDETLHLIVNAIAQQNPVPFDMFKIVFDGKTYQLAGRTSKHPCHENSFLTKGGKKGTLLYCLSEQVKKNADYRNEQEHFLRTLVQILIRFLNKQEWKEVNDGIMNISTKKPGKKDNEIITGKFLHRFLNKNTYTRDIYHDLMPFKVREILLISSLYDAYSIEREGRFSEHMLGQFGQLNLTSIPRITGVSSAQQALNLLRKRHFDQIIYMVGVDKKTPVSSSRLIKEQYPYIPIFMLLNNNSDVSYFKSEQTNLPFIDRIFAWNGDTNIFFSMIKLLEDKINVENDTKVGAVRVILLAEDSPIYSSRYLSFLYRVLMEQTRRIIEDVSTDELYKVLRMRARPKILFAPTFEQAVEIVDKYKDNLLCLITDVKFKRFGKMDDQAGIQLLDYARKELKELPVVMQSSDPMYAEVAAKYDSIFIDKNSETLYEDLQHFITYNLGFGDFIFKNEKGDEIARAANLREFEHYLEIIPDDSLLFHSYHNHFSMWLMARQEIKAANFINPKKVSDFIDVNELRRSLVSMIREHLDEQVAGNIIPYEPGNEIYQDNFYTLSDGSLGGKGRGLAFINALIHSYDFQRYIPDINIKTPVTFIIGSMEFEEFLSKNQLNTLGLFEKDHIKVKKAFLNSPLSDSLKEKLRALLEKITKPIAIRSSSLFEDSLTLPFAGIFETYILPNAHEDVEVRLKQLCDAIKLVYASLYSDVAKSYVRAIDYKLEDERMAVIIEEVVGNRYDNYFYPHISGVAQSYNYYPFAHMKPDEGFALAAVGLGKYVVEGNRAYRFSPKYPGIEINSPKDQFKTSQVKFCVVDLNKKNLDLMVGEDAGLTFPDIDIAEQQGVLKHCASVYNPDSDTIYPGLSKMGPRIINFANILKYNYIPLSQTISLLLELGKEAMGTAVEIEYAVDLTKDEDGKASFYILQIKPLISQNLDNEVDINKVPKKSVLLYSGSGMGNGVIEDLKDVIYVDREKFDKSKTEEMVGEIERLNEQFMKERKQYVLIGPGRWGTRDKWIGIPVRWPQISKAKIIVETSLTDFPLEASSGSHFFHNVTSMKVGYFMLQHSLKEDLINYEMLEKQEIIFEGRFFKHVRFKDPFKVIMDGKRRNYLIQIHNKH